MKGCGRTMMIWAVVGLLGGVVVAEELTCGRGCHCWTEVTSLKREYHVICNETTGREVTLTETIFPGEKKSLLEMTSIRLELSTKAVDSEANVTEGLGDREARVTAGFFGKWREYYHCALYIRGGRLFLPEVVDSSLGFQLSDRTAGLSLVNVALDVLPGGLFSGKRAKLQIFRSSVGRIAAGLLRGVNELQYMEIQTSTVGVFEGPLGTTQLQIGQAQHPLYVYNTTIGILLKGAFRIGFPRRENLVLKEVTIGVVSEGGFDVSGSASVELSNCRVADLRQHAFKLESQGKIAINSSWLNLRPGALSQFTCAFHANHIHSNNILLLPGNSAYDFPNTYDQQDDLELLNNDTLNFLARERLMEELGQALHSTCVKDNLPSWLPQLSSTGALPLKNNKRPLLLNGLYILVGVSVMAMLLVVLLACLLTRSRRRIVPTNSPVMVMSQLAEDPIYEDVPVPCSAPPPVPPPTTIPRSHCMDKMGACSARDNKDDLCAAKSSMDNFHVSRPLMKAQENNYMVMRSNDRKP
ncbi:uncharacterized protein LOC121869014 [Homarus americanus]|uniref:uncharacterized protein LOC121869014 n=1 Tax=Homarus americanus TaxID=6706 RepID=UPI001C49146D|nr:uncharacterized protein LOC121869014 [Homarus americanus]